MDDDHDNMHLQLYQLAVHNNNLKSKQDLGSRGSLSLSLRSKETQNTSSFEKSSDKGLYMMIVAWRLIRIKSNGGGTLARELPKKGTFLLVAHLVFLSDVLRFLVAHRVEEGIDDLKGPTCSCQVEGSVALLHTHEMVSGVIYLSTLPSMPLIINLVIIIIIMLRVVCL
jgi:hypothetical protein